VRTDKERKTATAVIFVMHLSALL